PIRPSKRCRQPPPRCRPLLYELSPQHSQNHSRKHSPSRSKKSICRGMSQSHRLPKKTLNPHLTLALLQNR
ncbi:hypothetical protein Pgy4_15334, partial [Pseudomonas savastanoi pv. glycinea str. race 4]